MNIHNSSTVNVVRRVVRDELLRMPSHDAAASLLSALVASVTTSLACYQMTIFGVVLTTMTVGCFVGFASWYNHVIASRSQLEPLLAILTGDIFNLAHTSVAPLTTPNRSLSAYCIVAPGLPPIVIPARQWRRIEARLACLAPNALPQRRFTPIS